MAVILPLLCVALTAALWRRTAAETLGARREAFVVGAVLAGVLTVAIAEVTSLARVFDRTVVTCLWAAAAIVLGTLLQRGRESSVRPASDARSRLERTDRLLLLGFAAFAVAVGITAWASAPNNWDSMTYHLPRVLHWIQDRSIGDYPTSIVRQLTLAPGAELAAAQVQLLEGSDRCLDLLQAFAWLGCAAAASLVAKDLGAGLRGQIAAAIFAATLPMALVQATSTQNDLVVSFWLLAFTHFALRVLGGDGRIAIWLLVGASLGLSLLTKATALLFAFPLAAGLLLAVLRPGRSPRRGGLVLAAVAALLLNVGAWSRNLALFGTPLGGEHGAVNTSFAPSILASNLVRNAALQLASPSRGWNQLVEDAALRLHRAAGLDANDVRSTWRGAEFHVPARLAGAGPADSDEAFFAAFHEDQAGNPIHVLLLIVTAALVLARRRLRKRKLVLYLVSPVAAFVLFSLVLKWQPWGARLELPLLLLAAPGIAVWEDAASARWSFVLPAVLLVTSLPWALLNATRPLLGADSVLTTPRLAQSFANRPLLGKPLAEASEFVASRGCRHIGLELGPDDPEYLVWLSLRAAGARPERLEHVRVKNRSQALASVPPFAGFSPCAVIELAPPGAVPPRGTVFARSWTGGWVLVKAGAGPP